MELLILTLIGVSIWGIMRACSAPDSGERAQRDCGSLSEQHALEALDAPTDNMPASGNFTNAEQDTIRTALARDAAEYWPGPDTSATRTVRSSTRLFSGAEEGEASEAIRRALEK